MDSLCRFGGCSILNEITIFLQMAHVIHNVHIIHFHMDAARLVALGLEVFQLPLLFGGLLLDPNYLVGSYQNNMSRGTKCIEMLRYS